MAQPIHPEPIAVIGSACRFPGRANSPSKLWDLLSQPRDVLKTFDPERLNLERFYHQEGDTHGATDVQNKAYLLEEDPRLFDASFFGINAAEAAGMDPQQRLLLETVFESFESAGVTLEQLRGSLTAVHVGVMTNDWSFIQLRDPENLAKYAATGTANSIMSNRISYVFDLKGPSETIDTACSSSLVALHNACQGLLTGDSDTAVVAGVNLIFDVAPFITESKLHMLSPDSRSRMWDKNANGYARGEGAASLLIKPLSKALQDGDHIEAVIRSTGVNSDGQSPGITMPFAPTQAALIRHTYRRAGLDPVKDRPQYFECHGTGTQAGDPVEARAVSEVFVKGAEPREVPLYVGSVKTVIGHLEGCAGLAGVLKVLLALKNRTIPPNLLFEELSPAVAPFYGPIKIPTKAIPWPEVPEGQPARASVNSFGFGGTNAHCIIESFKDNSNSNAFQQPSPTEGPLGPLLFSAKSGPSLLRSIQAHFEHLKTNPEIELLDLSSSLQTHRTTHRVRAHFSGATRDRVLTSMESFITNHTKSASGEIGYSPKLVNSKEIPGVLGIFTGQGAQWATMSRDLIRACPLFRRTLEECEAVLRRLPGDDAPEWSLVQELTAEASKSRIGEAAFSQPLCTAVQLGLVNLLKASGVYFDAVVGHSSGEIAAVYACGILSLEACMQIAYYRGFYAKLALGNDGERGGMMATGLSYTDAQKFCQRPEFEGRLQVAASNSPTSVTLSGDLNAIHKAKEEFDNENIFARPLKVDTAYHSHHMHACAGPYLRSLEACNIQVSQPEKGRCIWSSSVRGNTQLLRGNLESLKGPYWVANMVQTVLFSQAIDSSIWHGGPFDLAIEVGPHPALKGPVEQCLKATFGQVPAYTGVLGRGKHDVEAISSGMGVAWAQLGPSFVNFKGFRKAFYEAKSPEPRLVKNLPPYSWDHENPFWRESRLSRRYRLGTDKGHELLGRRAPDDNDVELRWRNVLKLSELPWIKGHEVLDEVLLPGAAYVAIAVEAGKYLAQLKKKSVKLFVVEDMDIQRPVVVPDDKDGTETMFTTHVDDSSNDMLLGRFSYYVCTDSSSGAMMQTCRGKIRIQFGSNTSDALPPRDQLAKDLVKVDCEKVYSMFQKIGLNYSGVFNGIKDSSRCLDYATASSQWPEGALSSSYIIHPAMLDVAFQSLFIARAHPASGLLTAALLPSHIDRVQIDPAATFIGSGDMGETTADYETWAIEQTATSLVGDLNIYDHTTGRTFLQVEGLATNTVGAPDASNDRLIFGKTVWANDVSGGILDPPRNTAKDNELMQLTTALERMALYYTKEICNEVGMEERKKLEWFYRRELECFDEHLKRTERDQHTILRKDWLSDDIAVVKDLRAQFPQSVEMQMIQAIGTNMVSVYRGEKQLLEVVQEDDLLNRFYMEDSGCIRINDLLAETAQQITFKYPRCNILEIGAGTGGTTWSVLNKINDAYESYTYTDISSGFFPNATEKFAAFASKMVFKPLDIEKDVETQAFAKGSYDIIIAANVIHATHNLENTLRNVRSLLKPGGYFLLFETTGIQTLRVPFCFGGFSGWWLSEEPERRLSPLRPTIKWDELFQSTGFSGADNVILDVADESKHTLSLLVSQAVDDDFWRLREPLSSLPDFTPPTGTVLVIGGKTLHSSKLITELQKLLPRAWKRTLRIANSIDDINIAELSPGADIICLHEIDEALFANPISKARMETIQNLMMRAKNLLWVTTGGKSHKPRASIFHGVARTVPTELPQLHMQYLSLELGGATSTSARGLFTSYLRLRESTMLQEDSDGPSVLWAREEEAKMLADGTQLIPRVVPDIDMNETFVASQRSVTRLVDATDIAVQAVPGPSRMMVQIPKASDVQGTTPVQVEYALHLPSQHGDDIFIVCGRTADNSVLAISEVNASILHVEPRDMLVVGNEDRTPETLVAAADYLFATTLASMIEAGTALFYGITESFAAVVKACLRMKGLQAIFISTESQTPSDWLKVHSHATKRCIQHLLPYDVRLFVDCRSQSSPDSIASLIETCMPKDCVSQPLDARLLTAIYAAKLTQVSDINQHRGQTCQYQQLSAAELAGADASALKHQRYITNWQARKSLLISVPPLQFDGIFKADRTYLMVGAAGGLGLSICKWMVRQGVKHMAITSRNPKVDESMLEEARHLGAKVHVLPMDVSKKESVDSAIQNVRDTMPPIAGVCNAAMVLSDRLFLDMDADQFNGTLAGKVEGSEHLDSVFAHDDLDFFVMLSSSATVVGNIGQSNYHAANLFMTSLAEQRRMRGQAGSVIHIGYVSDVGYVTRNQNRQLDEHFHNMRLTALSETDVHHAFAKAIMGGKPDGSLDCNDIIMGLEPPSRPIAPDTHTPWLINPRLSHYVPSEKQQVQTAETSGPSNVKSRIEEAGSEEGAISAVIESFCVKLGSILQLPISTISGSVEESVVDLGIDSLIAMEVRMWFLKEVGVEVPVVKILGGDTVIQICTLATKKYLAKTMKKSESVTVAGESAPKENSAAEPPTPAPKHPRVDAAIPAISFPPGEERPLLVPQTSDQSLRMKPSIGSSDTSRDSDAATDSDVKADSDDTGTQSDYSTSPEILETSDEPHVKAKSPDELFAACMSSSQARIWFLSQHLNDPTANNMCFHYRLRGNLSMARFRNALLVATHHHEGLRTRYYSRLEDGQPMQGIMASSMYELTHFEKSDTSQTQREIDRIKSKVWDIQNGRTFEVSVLSRTNEEHDIVFGYHHIVMDVMGWYMFIQDLNTAYCMRSLDKSSAGTPAEYAAWERELERSGVVNEQLSFWGSEFATIPDVLPLLPMAKATSRPTNSVDHGSHHEYRQVEGPQFAAIKKTCQLLRISPFHLHLAVFQVLLARYANIEDVCIGIVDANRSEERFAKTVGCLVNVLPVRLHIDENSTVGEVLRNASRKALSAFSNSHVQLDQILDKVKAPRSSEATPLFQAAINYRTGGVWDLPLGDSSMKLSLDDGKDAENPFDISLGIAETSNGCNIEMHCQKSLYSTDACATLLDTYERLLGLFCKDEKSRINTLQFHDEHQVRHAVELGKGQKMDFAWPSTLSQRIQDMCNQHSNDLAINDGSQTISYGQLQTRLDATARLLIRAGCIPGSRIAVLCNPSIDFVVALLAILHIGAVYVPFDTSLPISRHQAMMEVCEPAWILSHAATIHRAEDLLRGSSIPDAQNIGMGIADAETDHPEPIQCGATADASAILLFTSGTTGVPKAIELTQANFRNHVALKTHVLGLGRETVLQQSSLGFDMSLIQICCALANGGLLVIAPSEIRRDPVEMAALVSHSKISLSIATPSDYLAWLRYGAESLGENKSWRHACMGGEPIPQQLKDGFRRLHLDGLTLTNCFGPTEITAAATFHTLDLKCREDEDKTNNVIGKVIPNYTLCIIDGAGHPQPTQHIGEICIGGKGVALGYLGLPEQTTTKFINGSTDAMSDRMYRTGDLGKILPDGTVICYGRIDGDTQVKVRGLRVELSEVELAVFKAADGLLANVVVSLRGDTLVAFATLAQGHEAVAESTLLSILGQVTLPQYFIPSTIIVLEKIPSTHNGKLDRKAIDCLPLSKDPSEGSLQAGPAEKLTVREGELRLLWERVLNVAEHTRTIGPSSDFFKLGGNSLRLMKLQAAIKETMSIHLSTRTLYQSSNLRQMSTCIDTQRNGNTVDQHIDWRVETAVPKWLTREIAEQSVKNKIAKAKTENFEILLTGAASFFGGRLLQSLVQLPTVQRVHCIAVPADDIDHLYRNDKVRAYAGSQLSPTLGLNTEERQNLEQNIDAIVHAGAHGHCLNTYDTLGTPNLLSTHTLASIALPRSIPILYYSSNRVGLMSGDPAPIPRSMKEFPPSVDGREGHAGTKWASEVFLENLVTEMKRFQQPFKVAVHRPCILASENAPNSDAMNGVLKYSLRMRRVPYMEDAQGYIDFADMSQVIDDISRDILQLASGQPEQGDSAITFKHHSGRTKTPISQFRERLESHYGGNFEQCDLREWIVHATEAGIDPLISAYLEGLLESGAPLVLPYMGGM